MVRLTNDILFDFVEARYKRDISAISRRVNKQTCNDTNGTVLRSLVRGQVVTPSYLIFLTITRNVQVLLVKLMLTFIEFIRNVIIFS